jgi:hypothetical protein
MTEIACMKEGSLGSEPFGGGVEAGPNIAGGHMLGLIVDGSL